MYLIVQIFNLFVWFFACEDHRRLSRRRSSEVRLKQADRTCWTIQNHADEQKAWAKRRTFHETNQTLIWVDLFIYLFIYIYHIE